MEPAAEIIKTSVPVGHTARFINSPLLETTLSSLLMCKLLRRTSLSQFAVLVCLTPVLFPTPLPTVVCFDAKINFDDNAEFRQKTVFAMDDMSESDPLETEAAKWDLKYIGLDGNIACFGTKTNSKRFLVLFLFLCLPHILKDKYLWIPGVKRAEPRKSHMS